MTKRTKAQAAEREAWRARRPWPIAVLGIDPGATAGAALVLPDARFQTSELCWARTIDVDTLALECTIRDAIFQARDRELGLVLVLEEWGRGGPMGIETWLGLGAARGHWIRAARLLSLQHKELTASRLFCYAHMQTWRSWMDVPAVVTDTAGAVVRRNTPEDWKKGATRRISELAPKAMVDSADAAEGALIALYGSRCDAVGKRLPARLLKAHGFDSVK